MLLYGDDPACLLSRLDDYIAVDGLDGVDVYQPHALTLGDQLIYSLEALEHAQTRSDDGDVGALSESDTLAQLELIGIGIVEAVYSQSA